METKPTHEQAQLQLQLYDLRREPRLRQARDWFFKNYHVENFEDAMRVAAPMTEGGTFFMMVVTYWDQACAFLNNSLLHEDLFFQSSGEFFGVWESIKPAIAETREKFVNRNFLAELERAAKRYESWMESRAPGHLSAMREWMKQMARQQQAAKA